MYGELPGSYASQRYYIALTISSGDLFAGLQYREMLVYWRRYDKSLALIAPQLEMRSTGEVESKSSVKRIFTDRVLLSVPIACIGPKGGPVIDLDKLFVSGASSFFGSSVRGALASRIFSIAKAKTFPKNVELAFEMPASNGQLTTLHYSISPIRGTPGYRPRKADERIGYFTTSYSDLGKYKDEDVRTRFINR